jgi:hypothetical protein
VPERAPESGPNQPSTLLRDENPRSSHLGRARVEPIKSIHEGGNKLKISAKARNHAQATFLGGANGAGTDGPAVEIAGMRRTLRLRSPAAGISLHLEF